MELQKKLRKYLMLWLEREYSALISIAAKLEDLLLLGAGEQDLGTANNSIV